MSWSTSNSTYGSYRSNQYSNQKKSKQSDEPVGLQNLTNTCYISAVLQVLFVILDERKLPITSKRQEITKLFFTLKQSRKTEDYKQFKKALQKKIEIIQGWQQQDAQQLLIGFLDELSKENTQQLRPGKINIKYKDDLTLKGNWKNFIIEMEKIQKSPIISLFYGQIVKQYTCPTKHRKYVFERYQHISLSFPQKTSRFYYDNYDPIKIQDMIKSYLGLENIDDLECEKCKAKRTFEKNSIFYKIPQYFILHLSRFRKGYFNNQKISSEVQFDQFLTLSEENSEKTSRFRLLGIVHHWGNLNRGHYYAEVRIGEDWYEVDDENVKPAQIRKTNNVSKSAYMLFYEKIG